MKRSIEVLVNILFWAITIYLYYDQVIHLGLKLNDNYGAFHIPHLYYVMFFLIAPPLISFYLFYAVLVPKLLVRKKILLFITIGLLSCVVVGYSFRMAYGGPLTILGGKFIMYTFLALQWGIIGCALKGIFLWVNSIADKRIVEKKHLESKNALLLLQAQINPHFLFNSLNNIDILIEEAPKTASEYLKKLSDILRYVLYETKEEETELAKEIAQITSYIDLQKLRTDNPRYVNFNITGQLMDQKIAPMVFIPFIENAFKHSKNKTVEDAINIDFYIDDNNIKMVCRNYFDANQIEVMKNEGLGNETIKRRLNLLYPKKHSLLIDATENYFTVTLTITTQHAN
jgi:two-component system, LytTR family, sensor kinase